MNKSYQKSARIFLGILRFLETFSVELIKIRIIDFVSKNVKLKNI